MEKYRSLKEPDWCFIRKYYFGTTPEDYPTMNMNDTISRQLKH